MPTSKKAFKDDDVKTEIMLKSLIRERILIMDGAMGTMLQKEQLTEDDFSGKNSRNIPPSIQGEIEKAKANGIEFKGNNELLSITKPDIIQSIHEKFLSVGADIIEANTFGATSVAQADYCLEGLVREMNLASVRIAKKACKKFNTKN